MDINYASLDSYHRTLSTAFFNSLASQPPVEWSKIAMQIRSSSSRNEYPFLGELDDMREWLGPRTIRQLASHKYSLDNRKFELTLSVKRDEMADDAGGAISLYSSIAAIKARSVAIQPDQLVMAGALANGHTTACYDGQNFFDLNHPVGTPGGSYTPTTVANDMGGGGTPWYIFDTSRPLMPLIYQNRLDPEFSMLTDPNNPHTFSHDEFVWGIKRRNAAGYGLWQTAVKSSQTLSLANLEAAILQMNGFKNDEGRNLGLNPDLLVVPMSLKFVARDLLDFRLGDPTSPTGADNRAYGLLPYMVSRYL
jgi:phage major head subunit gpT-like protein